MIIINLKNFKKVTNLLVALMMVLNLAIPFNVHAAESTAKVFDFIEITDFHGALEDSKGLPTAAVLAKNIKDIKKANPDRTLVIGGGDLYQGSPTSNVLKGVPVRKIMDNIGMEVTALGNHEFDWTIKSLQNVTMKDAKYSLVCANIYDKTTNKYAFDPYKIIVKDGVKIAVIGAITTETPSIVLPESITNYDFKDPVTEINKVAKEIRDGKKADVVLAVIHEGGFDDKGKTSGAVFDIAQKLTGIDVLFGGHTHSVVNSKVGNMPVVIANNAGKGFVDVKMTMDDKGKPSFTSEYVAIDTDKPNGYKAATPLQDPEVKALVEAAKVEIGPLFEEKLGVADETLTRTQVAKPYGESYLGNWVSDVTRNKVNADVGMGNNGGIRIDIPKGDITVGTMYYIMPFDNTICTLTLTKTQLKAVLEQAVNDADDAKKIAEGKGIQVSGIKFKYDMTRPSFDRITEITKEDGSEIKDSDKLKVATSNFLATGGDGFTELSKYESKDTGIVIRDALLEDVKAKKAIITKMNSRLGKAEAPVVKNNNDKVETPASTPNKDEKGDNKTITVPVQKLQDSAIPTDIPVETSLEQKDVKASSQETKAEIVYEVVAGDCLYAIGQKYGISYLDIAKKNNVVNVDLIFIGQKLIIPSN